MNDAMTRQLLSLLAGLALAACAAEDMPVWSLAGEPGLLYDVKRYYERNGLEEGGRCSALLLDGVTRTEVLEDTPERLVVSLGYVYRDMIRDGDDCDRLRPGRCFALRECRGFGLRTFTIARDDEGPEVIDMSGPQKRRRPQP